LCLQLGIISETAAPFALLIRASTKEVTRSVKPAEQLLNQRMLDLLRGFHGLHILLGNIGGMGRAMNQHVIPGLAFWRLRASNLLVPFLGSLKDRIHIEYYAVIVEQAVVNDLPHLEFCFLRWHGIANLYLSS
jgi:hypothetical protein